MNDIWKDVVGFEGKYQVSDKGAVASIGRAGMGREAPLFIIRDHKGYSRVCLYKHGKRKKYLVHRLVMRAFCGEPPPGKYQVNHIDGKPINNNLSNLEYVTHSENQQHSYRVLGRHNDGSNRRRNNSGRSKINRAAAEEIRGKHASGEVTRQELSDYYGLTLTQIGNIINYKSWSDSPRPRLPSWRKKLLTAISNKDAQAAFPDEIASILKKIELGQ